MWGLGPSHIIVLAIIAVLLFGDRLPEVMRSLGQGLVEFKKGMRGIENAIETSSTRRASAGYNQTESIEAAAEKSEPSTAVRLESPTTAPRLESISSTDEMAQSIVAPVIGPESKSHEAAP